MGRVAREPMNIRRAIGVDGARAATGVVVVIDVLRAFSVSAYALAGGARECLLVATLEEARELAAATPDAVLSAEANTLPISGIAISNSPTQITQADLAGRTLIQRTSAGTPAINAVADTLEVYAASLVVAQATARACMSSTADTVTLVASADLPEDHACAGYIESIIAGKVLDLDELLRPLFESERYQRLAEGDWPGFPKTDLELSLSADRFDFAMRATRADGHVRLHEQR